MPAPTMPPGEGQVSTNVQQVDWHGHGGYYHGGYGGYHHHDDYWGALAGFGVGALVGGLIANQPYYGGNYYQGGYYGGYPTTGYYTGPRYYGRYVTPRYYGPHRTYVYRRTYYHGYGYYPAHRPYGYYRNGYRY